MNVATLRLARHAHALSSTPPGGAGHIATLRLAQHARAFSSTAPGGARAPRKVTDYVADVLVRQGVQSVFGGPGGAVLPLVTALSTRPDLRWVYMRNEQAASLAACADAKLSGRLGVCVATSGPGSSHLTTGLIDALQDRVPVLALTGTKSTSSVDLSEFQMIHQVGAAQLAHGAGH
jgi:glyoxylate carboligase